MRLGADPEVFMTAVDGHLISAIGRIPGTKWKPFQMPELPVGFTIQQDNVAVEFGVPPAASAEEYVSHIRTIRQAGQQFIFRKGLSFSPLSCAVFPEDQMQDPEAFKFGCEPDYNAWTGKKNPTPKPPHPMMRSAGGHIHVETPLPKKPVIQAMDVHISIPAVLMDQGEQRKQLYGKAGAYRPKPYGVEYRTPSNFWFLEDHLVDWVWRCTENALKSVRRGVRYTGDADRIINCINNNDKTMAQKLIKEYKLDACY